MMQPAAPACVPDAVPPDAEPVRKPPAPCRAAWRALTVALTLSLSSLSAHGFDKLVAAQSLVYDTPHLANTAAGDTLEYRYTRERPDVPDLQDSATLDVRDAHEDGRRDVSVDFLSDERHLPLPDFDGWRGNPILLAMLEHVAQDLSAETGGGALYFRNRIRDAMASEQAVLEPVQADWRDGRIDATRLRFRPFENDAYLGARIEYAATEFSLVLSEAVPGGVVSVRVDASNDGALLHRRTLSLAEPTP